MVLYTKARKGGFLKKIFINLILYCWILVFLQVTTYKLLKMSKLSNYIKETMEEMKHVSWLTKKQTIMFSVLVIIISLAVAAYLGFFDYILSLGLKGIIGI